MIKYNRAVFYFCYRRFSICKVAFLIKNLYNTLCRCSGNNDHNKYHRQHHKTHQNLHRIRNKAHQLTGRHTIYRIISGCNDQFCTKPGNQNHTCIHAELHQRHIECDHFFCKCKIVINRCGNFSKFLNLMILPHIRFHNTDSVKIFLHNIVQFIVSFENFFKYWMCMCHNKIQSDSKNRCRRQKNHCHLRIYLKCHKHRKNKHDRCTDCHTDDHLICILHVGNVRCQTRYDTCR